jgi:coenzyme F420-0:L-glutamate ligase/coenzyme F420-1:gamma-L-glutamate ligase
MGGYGEEGREMKIEAIGLGGVPQVGEGEDLAKVVLSALKKNALSLQDRDVIVITEKVLAKAEGRLVSLDEVRPSKRAKKLSEETGKDPRLVELILQESEEVLGYGPNFLIVETHHGFICANAGIDQSNVPDGNVKLLPEDPDGSALRIRTALERETGKRIGVLISDSWGRPFRYGSIGSAIGSSGIRALWDRRRERDLLQNELKVTRVAVADSLAALASLVMGEGDEGVPIILIRGMDFLGEGTARDLLRKGEEDLFRRRGNPVL